MNYMQIIPIIVTLAAAIVGTFGPQLFGQDCIGYSSNFSFNSHVMGSQKSIKQNNCRTG